jgi:5-methylcytosine-specific restriction endonuclease McrA
VNNNNNQQPQEAVKPSSTTTLVLDGTYQPLGFFSARASVRHLITGRAKAFDRYGNLQDWDSWTENTSFHQDAIPYMRTATRKFEVPTIMVVTHFFGARNQARVNGKKEISLKYLYKVYQGTCQYCLEKIPFRAATKDHIYPKSKGGTNHSYNLVLSCKRCNSIKSDTFPYFNKNGEEVEAKNLLPIHHNTLFDGKIRPEWNFFLYKG